METTLYVISQKIRPQIAVVLCPLLPGSGSETVSSSYLALYVLTLPSFMYWHCAVVEVLNDNYMVNFMLFVCLPGNLFKHHFIKTKVGIFSALLFFFSFSLSTAFFSFSVKKQNGPC